MVKIFIDETEIDVEEGTTVFNAAKKADIEIPHFCYHPAFLPEGTCRMCLVEIEGVPKLELACSTIAKAGMKVNKPPVVSDKRVSPFGLENARTSLLQSRHFVECLRVCCFLLY